MVFVPSLDFGVSDGFYDLVEMLVSDIYKMASLVKRLAEHNGMEHYQVRLSFNIFHHHACLLLSFKINKSMIISYHEVAKHRASWKNRGFLFCH